MEVVIVTREHMKVVMVTREHMEVVMVTREHHRHPNSGDLEHTSANNLISNVVEDMNAPAAGYSDPYRGLLIVINPCPLRIM